MARARLIKPAFFGDVTLSEVCRDARLFYAGLWQHMDLRGLMEYHPKLVKRDLFPYDDDVTSKVIDGWVWELVRIRRLKVVDYDGKRYLVCPHLSKHQHFHHNEKPNTLIPSEVLGAPEVHPPGPAPTSSHSLPSPAPVKPQASPVPAPVKPQARPTDTDTDTKADTEAEADSDHPHPPPLIDLGDGIRLGGVTQEAFDAWVTAYGEVLVKAQVPLACAGWVSETPYKQASTTKARYIRHWLQNAAKDEAREKKLRPPKSAEEPELPKPTYIAIERWNDSMGSMGELESRGIVETDFPKWEAKGWQRVPSPGLPATPEPEYRPPKLCGRELAAGEGPQPLEGS